MVSWKLFICPRVKYYSFLFKVKQECFQNCHNIMCRLLLPCLSKATVITDCNRQTKQVESYFNHFESAGSQWSTMITRSDVHSYRFLQLLDQNRWSSTASVADTCQPVLAWLQVVHHVTHNSRPRHPDRRRQIKKNLQVILFLVQRSWSSLLK